MASEQLERTFPGLSVSPYEVTSPADLGHNCVAWAAGDATRKWWPRRGYYWPRLPDDESLQEFTHAFALLGYEVCGNPELEQGFEKVAIFAGPLGPAHMARQLPDGLWTSKCGDREDITHQLPALEGDEYGRVVQVMRRKRTTRRAG